MSFPDQVTRWSQVARAADGDSAEARAALAWLCQAYWEVLHRHAQRRGWKEAEDAVQDFWVHLIEGRGLTRADATKGRFRTWLLACLDHHLADRHAARQAQKRGGDRQRVPIDLVEDLPDAKAETAAFDRAWAQALLQRARQRLDARNADQRARYDRLAPFLEANGDAAAYAAVAADLGLSEGAVKVAVHRLRQGFRDCLRQEVAETLADPRPDEVDAELRDLLDALGG